MEFKTYKSLIENFGFINITEEFIHNLEESKLKKFDKFKEWFYSMDYKGVYLKDDKIILNVPTGTGLLYVKKAVTQLTGKQLVHLHDYVRQDKSLWESYKNMNQYTDGGEN